LVFPEMYLLHNAAFSRLKADRQVLSPKASPPNCRSA
jgi:hypothetical protein